MVNLWNLGYRDDKKCNGQICNRVRWGGSRRYSMKREYMGSYTVEAAILLPCILFFLMAMIYTAFFFHDILVVQTRLHIMALQEGSKQKENTGNLQPEEKIKVIEQINDRTCISDLTDIKTSEVGAVVEYQGSCEISMPVEGVREWIEKYISRTEKCKVKNKQHSFCKSLRRERSLLEICPREQSLFGEED